MKKAKRKNAARRSDMRTGGEAPRPEGLDRVENADSPAAREAALAEDAARSRDPAAPGIAGSAVLAFLPNRSYNPKTSACTWFL